MAGPAERVSRLASGLASAVPRQRCRLEVLEVDLFARVLRTCPSPPPLSTCASIKTGDDARNAAGILPYIARAKTTKLKRRLRRRRCVTAPRARDRLILSNRRPPTYSPMIVVGHTQPIRRPTRCAREMPASATASQIDEDRAPRRRFGPQ